MADIPLHYQSISDQVGILPPPISLPVWPFLVPKALIPIDSLAVMLLWWCNVNLSSFKECTLCTFPLRLCIVLSTPCLESGSKGISHCSISCTSKQSSNVYNLNAPDSPIIVTMRLYNSNPTFQSLTLGNGSKVCHRLSSREKMLFLNCGDRSLTSLCQQETDGNQMWSLSMLNMWLMCSCDSGGALICAQCSASLDMLHGRGTQLDV